MPGLCVVCETIFIHDDEVICEQCKEYLEHKYEEVDNRLTRKHTRVSSDGRADKDN
jgi:predicted nucleic acid-binding Zn ribbon protein